MIGSPHGQKNDPGVDVLGGRVGCRTTPTEGRELEDADAMGRWALLLMLAAT